MVRIARFLFTLLFAVLFLLGNQSYVNAEALQQNGREHSLVIRVLKPSKILVRVDGKLEFSGELSSGFRSEWSGKVLYLAVESGSEVEVTLNGQYFGVFGTSNQPSTLNWPPAGAGYTTEPQAPTASPVTARLSTEIRPLSAVTATAIPSTAIPPTAAPPTAVPPTAAPPTAAPVKPPASALIQRGSDGQNYYIVRSGDVLSIIAKELGVSADELSRVNNISNPALLTVGTRLYLSSKPIAASSATVFAPTPTAASISIEASAPVSTDLNYYTIKTGDILSGIAAEYGISTEDLIRINNISNPALLAVGTQLYLPIEQASPNSATELVTTTTSSSTSSEVVQGSVAGAASSSYYTVKPGDILTGIAAQFDVSTEELIRLNNISNPGLLTVGTQLYLPVSQTNPTTSSSSSDSAADSGSIKMGVPASSQPETQAADSTGAVSIGQVYYTVKSGEMLSSIALRFGLTVEELIAANNITDSSVISAGTELYVPTRQAAQDSIAASTIEARETDSGGAIYHTVKSGEMLSSIALQFGLTTEELIAANNIIDPSLISVGTQLYVPIRQQPADSADTSPVEPTADSASPRDSSVSYYTVKPGEMLSGIALQFGITIEELIEVNNISNPSLLAVGTELILPSSSQRVTELTPTPTSTLTPTPTSTPTLAPTLAPTPTPTATEVAEAAPAAQNYYYIVKPGEYLSTIAAKFDLTTQELIEANGISNPALIVVGTRLLLPNYAPSTSNQTLEVESDEEKPESNSSTSSSTSSTLITSPNELGSVLVLEYHLIAPGVDGTYSRTPASVRADMEWLYANNYYPIRFRDLTEGTIDIPAGKSPVVLAFDDSSIGQLRILDNGEVDPNSGIGVVWDFASRYSDFPPVVTAFPLLDVDVPSRILWGQPELADRKLQMIVEMGGEIGSHTVSHEQLDKVSESRIQWQLAYSAKWLEERIGNGYEVRSLALPLGLYPYNETLLRAGTSEGISYAYSGAAEVAGGPAFSPFSVRHDPYHIRRAQVIPGYIDNVYALLERQPTLKYISDGDPRTITIPSEATLNEEQRGTFNESAWPEYRVVRYER